MKTLISLLLLALLFWQAAELAVRLFFWEQKSPEVPFWACVVLLALSFSVILGVAMSLRRKYRH